MCAETYSPQKKYYFCISAITRYGNKYIKRDFKAPILMTLYINGFPFVALPVIDVYIKS